MSYQAGAYEVCCDCGVLIPLHRLPEHPVICNQTVPANKVTVQAQKVSVQDFLKQGRYLIDEVKRRAEKGSPFFFTPETMRFFSSRVSELAWSKGDLKDYQTEDIYFITSERDTSFHKHSGSTRGYTVRLCDKTGDIQKVSEFQEFGTLAQARKSIKEVLEK